jgi:calcineurin-like phosphoesterase family protein
MALVYVTADTHIDHSLVASLRGFDSPAAHDEVLIESWNSVVTKRDHVWVLGDLCISSSRERWVPVVERLLGTIHLVSGNHDGCHPYYGDSHRQQRLYLEHLASVQPFAKRKINGQRVLMSHFPYSGDRGDTDRFSQFRLRDEGLPLLHGHTHSLAKRSLSTRGSVQVHVGWDAWQRPVDVDELAPLLRVTE